MTTPSSQTNAGLTSIPTSLVSTTSNPTLGVLTFDGTVLLTLTFSQAVSVTGGVPTLTLDDGGTATFDPAQSTATALVFSNTVQLGENSPGLQVTAADTNGATITDAQGNPVSISGAVGTLVGAVQVDTTPPAVLAVTTDPMSGDLAGGATISFTFAMSEPTIILGGPPTLSLNDGGLAVFDPTRSSGNRLVFTHVVQIGENVAALGVTGLTMNGGVVADAVGNSSLFADALIPAPGSIQIDTTPPTIVSVLTNAVGGTLGAGQNLSISLIPDEAVSVIGGSPALILSDGNPALFDPVASSSTALVFDYVVPAEGTTASLAVSTVALGGATIADGAGNALVLSGALVALFPSLTAAAPTSPGAATASASDTTPTAVVASGAPAQAADIDPVTATLNPAAATIRISTVSVYRFFDVATGTHFYTSDEGERRTILATRPDLVPEGTGLRAIDPSSNDPLAAPVFRFFDQIDGTQFLTASATERDTILATRPDLVYEPTSAILEHTVQQAGDIPVYRFFDSRFGTHFYTDSPGERASILATRPDLIAEGIGFFERGPV